jgi:hypothetical protein
MSKSTPTSEPGRSRKDAKPRRNHGDKSRSIQRDKRALPAEPRITRTTFCTSRQMDFFSAKELVTQTGHPVNEWPQVIVKELVDNALDACEETTIPPVIQIAIDGSGIAVKDNGPGLPEATLKSAMDFDVRSSSREAYVAPDRGAQGNALKTLLPMPTVLDAMHGKLVIDSGGKRHEIRCTADPISQRAKIADDVSEQPTIGTEVRLVWGAPSNSRAKLSWPFDPNRGEGDSEEIVEPILRLLEGYAIFNPHASFRLKLFGREMEWNASDTEWQKWKPHRPTSAHWYELRHLKRLIGAYVTHDRDCGSDRLISDFIGEFNGFTGSKKRATVLGETGSHRMRLSELVAGGTFNSELIAHLLASMQKHSRPIKSESLGVIGEEHLRARLLAMGVQPKSFQYARRLGDPKSKNSPGRSAEKASFISGIPFVVESAFGWLGPNAAADRRIYSGANWSAAISNPFRSFGTNREGLEAALADLRAGQAEPIVFVLHLAQPRIEYTDRGKSALLIGE